MEGKNDAMAQAAQKVCGEWLVNASIMQCHDALVGRIHLTEGGDMVYMAGGGDLIGRGFGKWVAEGPVVGFQCDIFQYSSSSTKHVQQEAHRFRGIALVPSKETTWTGEWYFVAYRQPPRLVGRFQCVRRNTGPLGSTSFVRAVEDCPYDAKKAVVAKLDKMVEMPPLLEKRWEQHLISSDVPGVYYVRNFLEPRQVEELERIIDRTCDWETMATRDTQEFGVSQRCPCGRSLMRADLPHWQANIINALHNLGAFHPVLYPANSVRLNAYAPGQGIHPHLDGPVYYPRAATVSLGSHCIFDFYPRETSNEEDRVFSWDRDKEVPSAPDLPPGTEPKLSVLLEPGSLLLFSGDGFVHHRHGIHAVEEDEIGPQVANAKDIGLSVGDSLRRTRRTSLTIRHLLPRCMCSSIV